MKTCTRCGISKQENQYSINSSNSDGKFSYCRDCSRQYRKEYRAKTPWKLTYRSIYNRCENPNKDNHFRYGGKGIRCLVTPEQLRDVWFRDGAANMSRPSIDRIDSKVSYTIDNIRYIELSENSARAKKREKSGASK